MSRRLHFLSVCLVQRFVRSECFRAAKSTELVPKRRGAKRHEEEEGGGDAEKLVLYCLFLLFLLAQSDSLPLLPAGAALPPLGGCFLLLPLDEMHRFLLNPPHFLLPFGFC